MPPVNFRLYLVTAREQTRGRPLVPLVSAVSQTGRTAVQLREKDLPTRDLLELAREVLRVATDHGSPVLINDRVDLALAVGAHGIHLRSNSIPVTVARRLLGADRLIGVSTHGVVDVLEAESAGADFVVLGPVYDTPSKRGYGTPIGLAPLEEASRRTALPIFAIGGVTASRVRELRGAGAFGVAVISSILSAPDVAAAARALMDGFDGCP